MGTFHFRQFSVCDDGATMKVGTDAVLLGAWMEVNGTSLALDIGTGCGVIALMIAQRTDAFTHIDAIDIHKEDIGQARINVMNSPWPERIILHQKAVQEFSPDRQYALIASNPPFFSDSLLPPGTKRGNARHQVTLTSEELLASVDRLLASDGRFCLILPASQSQEFELCARKYQLLCSRLTRFYTRKGKPQERTLLEFRRPPVYRRESDLTLYQAGDRWSDDYSHLTQAFYLPRQS